ncbi:MAG: NRDE family protein [Phycisphaerales bacterium]|nr:NRDE family protein [Phycisphaerales bacterium]
MCTVSVIPLPSAGFRLVTNRDESRRRAAADPPEWRGPPALPVRALWPTDTHAGGTWVAAAETGLALALLNVNAPGGESAPPRAGRRSRGLLIPSLIDALTADEAADRLAAADLARFDPFRLVAVQPDARGVPRSLDAVWDGERLHLTAHGQAAVCFASSGLGDAVVLPRLPLFEELVVAPGPTPEAQDAFHAHRWPHRPEISVLMSRDAARTVSVTAVEVTPAARAASRAAPRSASRAGPRGGAPGGGWSVRMAYRPVPEAVVVGGEWGEWGEWGWGDGLFAPEGRGPVAAGGATPGSGCSQPGEAQPVEAEPVGIVRFCAQGRRGVGTTPPPPAPARGARPRRWPGRAMRSGARGNRDCPTASARRRPRCTGCAARSRSCAAVRSPSARRSMPRIASLFSRR